MKTALELLGHEGDVLVVCSMGREGKCLLCEPSNEMERLERVAQRAREEMRTDAALLCEERADPWVAKMGAVIRALPVAP